MLALACAVYWFTVVEVDPAPLVVQESVVLDAAPQAVDHVEESLGAFLAHRMGRVRFLTEVAGGVLAAGVIMSRGVRPSEMPSGKQTCAPVVPPPRSGDRFYEE